MRAALFTREFPPHIYGGAGVHVEYLSRELAKKIDVEVHCWGNQHSDVGRLHVRGQEPWAEITNGTTGKFKTALDALSLNLTQVKALEGIDIVPHPHLVRLDGRLPRQEALQHPHRPDHALARAPARRGSASSCAAATTCRCGSSRTALGDGRRRHRRLEGHPRRHPARLTTSRPDRVHVIYNGIDSHEYQPGRRQPTHSNATASIRADPSCCSSAASPARRASSTWCAPSR